MRTVPKRGTGYAAASAALVLCLCVPLLWSASTEEDSLAARLTAEATEVLDQLLGPGRAKVLVTVQAERTEVRTQSEVVTPIQRPAAKEPDNTSGLLPGFVTKNETRKKVEEKDFDYVQKDQEQSLRASGLVVKSIKVAVVLDNGLSDVQVNAVRRILPDLLRMESDRGDVLNVLRAPMLPLWQRAFLNEEGVRHAATMAAIVVVVVGLAIFFAIVAYVISMGVVRTFVREMANRRGETAGGPMPMGMNAGGGALPGGGGASLGELLPGGIPGLGDDEGGGMRPVAALGRRFDFLGEQGAEELTMMLSKESPDDLSLLFGYLADSNPEMATRLFGGLPEALKAEVSQSLLRLSMADPERLAMLENRLKTAVEFGVPGPDRLGRILSLLPAEEREGLMGDLLTRDAAGAEKLDRSLFPFERIADLPAQDQRRLLTAVSYQEWGVALRGAADDIVERILQQLPPGPRGLVRDAMAVPQSREKILEVRAKILGQVYDLAAKGTINLRGAGASPELI